MINLHLLGLQTFQRPTLTRLFLAACPVGLFLFLLSFTPLPAGVASTGPTSVLLTRLTVVGTFILGTLSGFGAVDNAWKYFPILFRQSRQVRRDSLIGLCRVFIADSLAVSLPPTMMSMPQRRVSVAYGTISPSEDKQ